MKVIDSHIHIDLYKKEEQAILLSALQKTDCLIAVSMDLPSSEYNLKLARKYPSIKPAFGFHPEQAIPSDKEQEKLFDWMERHVEDMVAVGEVGLPYYLRQDRPDLVIDPYVRLLERFIMFAKKHNKPIILHTVYEDADDACKLLEKHQIKDAHFHWFKGDEKTIQRMIRNGYFISVTPDVCYEEEIQHLISMYPIELMMIETDGPWKFDGPFAGKMTVPDMMHTSVKKIAEIKQLDETFVYHTLYKNTVDFYRLKKS